MIMIPYSNTTPGGKMKKTIALLLFIALASPAVAAGAMLTNGVTNLVPLDKPNSGKSQ